MRVRSIARLGAAFGIALMAGLATSRSANAEEAEGTCAPSGGFGEICYWESECQSGDVCSPKVCNLANCGNHDVPEKFCIRCVPGPG